MIGFYIVYSHPMGVDDPDDIAFQLTEEARHRIPPAQSQLKSEIEKTLLVLRGFLPKQDPKFRSYYDELLGLAQYGLVGQTAQPVQAFDTLRNLQRRIFDMEKGNVISGHMATIMKSLLALMVVPYVFAAVWATTLLFFQVDMDILYQYTPLLLVLPGLFVGLTFSSFLRCRAVTFFDLHAIDADRFSPYMRGAFALMLLVMTGSFLKAGVFEIMVGKAHLSAFDDDILSAFVFGAVVGFAQEPLISRIETFGRKIGVGGEQKLSTKDKGKTAQ